MINRQSKIANRKSVGFTLIELLVVIAIISLLVSILLPSLQKARELARQAVCMSQMKHIGIGLVLYLDDFNQVMPMDCSPEVPAPRYYWPSRIAPYIDSGMPNPSSYDDMIARDKWFFWCPSNTDYSDAEIYSSHQWMGSLYQRSYGANDGYFSNEWFPQRKFTDVEQDIILIMDAWGMYLQSFSPADWSYWQIQGRFRHNDRANLLWSDFHVGSSRLENLDDADFYSE